MIGALTLIFDELLTGETVRTAPAFHMLGQNQDGHSVATWGEAAGRVALR